MKFEIINPSDPYTLEAEHLDTAAVACCLLGEGKYALRQSDGDKEVPLFLFGGVDDWFKGEFGVSYEAKLEEILANRQGELADVLDSVRIKGCQSKEDCEKARSSLNDIGGKAWKIAAKVRVYRPEGEAA